MKHLEIEKFIKACFERFFVVCLKIFCEKKLKMRKEKEKLQFFWCLSFKEISYHLVFGEMTGCYQGNKRVFFNVFFLMKIEDNHKRSKIIFFLFFCFNFTSYFFFVSRQLFMLTILNIQ